MPQGGRMDIESLRQETPGCANRVHLNNAGAGLLSRRTLQTMTAHLELEAAIGGYEAAKQERSRIDATYAHIAELVGGRADEVALFDNSTHAWNAAFYSLAFQPGDRILTGRAEYGSNVLAYLQDAERTGAEIVVVPDDASGQTDTAALAGLIDERTKLVGVSHIPTSGGLVNPAAEIGRIARRPGVPFLLDATQSVGQFPVDVAASGATWSPPPAASFCGGHAARVSSGSGPKRSSTWTRPSNDIEAATWDGGRGFIWHEGARRFACWEMSYSNVLGLDAAVRPGPRPGHGSDRPTGRLTGRTPARAARRPARRQHLRPRPRPVRHRDREGPGGGHARMSRRRSRARGST